MNDSAAPTGFLGGGRTGDRFRAVMIAVVPEAASLVESEWREALAIIDRALAARPATTRRQIRSFLTLLSVIAFVRHGRSIGALDVETRTRLLDGLGHSRMLIIRRGVWAVRTLAFMGYYARPDAACAIGYRGLPEGWAARRDAHVASR